MLPHSYLGPKGSGENRGVTTKSLTAFTGNVSRYLDQMLASREYSCLKADDVILLAHEVGEKVLAVGELFSDRGLGVLSS